MYSMGDENHSNGYHWVITLSGDYHGWWISWLLKILGDENHFLMKTSMGGDYHFGWRSLIVGTHLVVTIIGWRYWKPWNRYWMDIVCMKSERAGQHWCSLTIFFILLLSLSVTRIHGLDDTWSLCLIVSWSYSLLTLWSQCHMVTWSHSLVVSWSLRLILMVSVIHGLMITVTWSHTYVSQSLRVFVCGSHGPHSLMVFGLLVLWSYDLLTLLSHGLMTTWFHGSWSLWHTGS